MRLTRKLPFLAVAQACVRPRTWKVSRLAQPAPLAIAGGEPPEFDQSRLVGRQFQAEPREPVAKLIEEPPRIVPMLEADDVVVGEAHDDHITARVPPAPPVGP